MIKHQLNKLLSTIPRDTEFQTGVFFQSDLEIPKGKYGSLFANVGSVIILFN